MHDAIESFKQPQTDWYGSLEQSCCTAVQDMRICMTSMKALSLVGVFIHANPDFCDKRCLMSTWCK